MFKIPEAIAFTKRPQNDIAYNETQALQNSL